MTEILQNVIFLHDDNAAATADNLDAKAIATPWLFFPKTAFRKTAKLKFKVLSKVSYVLCKCFQFEQG